MPQTTYCRQALPWQFIQNPFNPVTTLEFDLPMAAYTSVAVYDLTGRQVQIVAGEMFSAGHHQLTVDASSLPSGIYFAHVRTLTSSVTQKMVLLR